jgi:hypothetical protein
MKLTGLYFRILLGGLLGVLLGHLLNMGVLSPGQGRMGVAIASGPLMIWDILTAKGGRIEQCVYASCFYIIYFGAKTSLAVFIAICIMAVAIGVVVYADVSKQINNDNIGVAIGGFAALIIIFFSIKTSMQAFNIMCFYVIARDCLVPTCVRGLLTTHMNNEPSNDETSNKTDGFVLVTDEDDDDDARLNDSAASTTSSCCPFELDWTVVERDSTVDGAIIIDGASTCVHA